MARLLQINTFPTLRPVHGGQRRAHHTARVLEAAGFEVRRVAAYRFEYYAGHPSEPAVDLKPTTEPRKPTTWLFDGVKWLVQDTAALAAFHALCESAAPDAILLEEPWLWPALRTLPAVASGALPVVCNSYNIEGPLFAQVVPGGGPHAEAAAAEVGAIEAEIAVRAAACSAVTAEDAAALVALGARRVVVASNGVERRYRTHLAGALPDALDPSLCYVLYVASAHPPNASGIPDLFTAMLTALRPLERLVVAGGVCQLINRWFYERGGPSHLARGRAVLFGEISDFCLDGLIANASGIVLPLRKGGGSNLKTAEALDSLLPVVVTPTAMRGYEEYSGLEGVIVAEDAAAFAAGLRRVFDDPPPRRQPGPALDRLLWDSTLRPIVDLVREVVGTSNARVDGTGRRSAGAECAGGAAPERGTVGRAAAANRC
jgi:glycosyltransferase involved in cell wall biosynthesis